MDSLTRLKVTLRGTKRSIVLEDGEKYEFKIPTWIPNPDSNIYNINDYLDTINHAANQKGDFVESILIEVFDGDISDEDLSSKIPLFLEEDEHHWKFKSNYLADLIQDIVTKKGIFLNGIDEASAEILIHMTFLFGFGNPDPADAIEQIESKLLYLGYFDD